MSGSMERVRRLLLAELKLTIPDLTSMWVSDLQVKKTEPDTGSCGSCQVGAIRVHDADGILLCCEESE
uniref:Uncharacterized protein n=1 Tax=Physcomitrium patens TaxID=3218 RepID=A0A2K1L8T9_PHYPA|nr:hypothetical protein PHYPA_000856 [Physcomitrium patens]